MECSRVKKEISLFFEDEMEEREMKEFIEHIEKCKDCMEEVTIHYLSTEGLVHLEEGTAFDLDSDLKILLLDRKARIRLKRKLQFIIYGVEILFIAVLAVVLAYVLL